MRCVSKCFMGRSFKLYLLLIGVVLGFAVSTVFQVTTDLARQQANPRLGKKEAPLQRLNLEKNAHVASEEDVQSLELSDYDYNHRGMSDETKIKMESEGELAKQNVHHKTLSPPSFPALAVPKPRSLSSKEQEETQEGENSDDPPLMLSDKLPSRQTLLIGVITSLNKLMTQTLAIQGTWGPRAAEVIFFVGEVERIPHLPPKMKIVKLEGVDDGEGGREVKEIAAIKHMADKYLDRVDWFMLVGDETYLAPGLLEKKLNSIDARYQIYMGRPSSAGRGKSEGSLCQRDPGVVYSRGMMENLKQYLPTCWPGGQGGGASLDDCILSMQVKCTDAQEIKELFLSGMTEVIQSSDMFSNPELRRAMAVHPVHFPKYMYRLHSLFMELEYNALVTVTKEVAGVMQSAQPFIPSHLRSAFHIPASSDPASSSTSTPPTCPPVKQIPKSEGGVVLRPRHKPKNKFEINYWEYFNQTRLMTIMNESPARGIIGGFREEARFALTKAIYLANQGVPQAQRFVFDKLENGYHRMDPMRGSEFILDFVFHRQSDRKSKIRKRLAILRPFHETVLPVAAPEVLPTVNFLVTLSGLSSRLEHFLEQYASHVLMQGEDATLTIVLFDSPDAPKVRSMVRDYQEKYVGAPIKVVDLVGEFARGVGLHHGMKLFSDEQLVFIVDVDLNVSTDFLQRCRLNAMKGKQVYFPVFFKLYKQDFVNRYHRGNQSLKISRHNGHWAHYSYGMVCIHAGDYHKLKGFDISMRGWGEEDVDLLDQVLKAGMEVFRAPDPGLVHNWHPKSCSKEKITNSAAYEHCLQSKGENLADRIELARYVFDSELLKGNSDL